MKERLILVTIFLLPVDIMKVNSIRVNIDIIQGRYAWRIQSLTMYLPFPRASLGNKVFKRPSNLIYYPILRYDINYIRLWLTNQNERPIDLRDEPLSITIELRKLNLKK